MSAFGQKQTLAQRLKTPKEGHSPNSDFCPIQCLDRKHVCYGHGVEEFICRHEHEVIIFKINNFGAVIRNFVIRLVWIYSF